MRYFSYITEENRPPPSQANLWQPRGPGPVLGRPHGPNYPRSAWLIRGNSQPHPNTEAPSVTKLLNGINPILTMCSLAWLPSNTCSIIAFRPSAGPFPGMPLSSLLELVPFSLPQQALAALMECTAQNLRAPWLPSREKLRPPGEGTSRLGMISTNKCEGPNFWYCCNLAFLPVPISQLLKT